jgi:hypothetical protein
MPWKPIDQVSGQASEQFAPPEENVSWYRDLVTGENRTEFPEMPEFGQVAFSPEGPKFPKGSEFDLTGISKSAISSDPKAQLDILRKNIPGLEARPDKFGNIMVRAPGMKDFTYLNKPGASSRDLDEFGTQTLATLPFLGLAGGGGGLLTRAAKGAAGLTGASVAEDAMAVAAGSEQGIDPEKAALSGLIGGASAGVLEPIIGGTAKAIGRAVQYPISRARGAINPEAEAKRRLTGAGKEDFRTNVNAGKSGFNLTPNEVRAARQRGQDPRVMDVGGETLRAEARRAANLSPSSRQTLQDFISDRFEGQGVRLGDFISKLVRGSGSSARAPSVVLTREQLQNAARASRTPLYKQAYADGSMGVTTPLLKRLEQSPALQESMKRATREMANRVAAGRSKGVRGSTGNYTLEFWDLTKRRLDDMVGELKRNGRASEALDLDSVRKQLLKELDNLVPAYKKARGTAAEFFGAVDALEAGEKFLKERFDLNLTRRALASMSQEERELFKEGFASKLIFELNRIPDRRNVLNTINASKDAQERLKIALGNNKAREVESFLEVEQFMDFIRGAMGNSTTVRQLMELGLGGYGLYSGDPYALALAGFSWGGRWAGRKIDEQVAEKVVKQLLSNDVDTFMKGVKQVASSPMLNAIRTFDNRMNSLGIGRAVTGAEAAEGLAADAPTPNTPPGTPPANLPAQGGGPGTPPPSTPLAPPSGGVPGPASQNPIPPDQVVNNDLDMAEAYRMASEAISGGADPEAVRQRLAEYGIDPAGLA